MIARLALAMLLLLPATAMGQQNLSTGGSPTFRGVTATERLCSPDAIVVTCAPYSLLGDDSTDETSAIQALLDANKGSTKPIIFPAGKTFRISAVPKIRGWEGGRLLGYGAKIRWVGTTDPTCDQAAGQPECNAFFKIEASKAVTIEGFEFIASGGGAKPGYGVYISSYQPLVTAGNPQISDTRIDVTTNPNLRRGYAASGTAYIAGTDAFTYTSIGTSAGACGGVGPFCFLGVAGIGSNYGTTQQIWFTENPKTPSNNVLRNITVNGAASVAGFQFGDNGYDYGCNTGNDDPWNVDANWGYALATTGTLPLWGFRQQGVTSAGTLLEDSSRLAGTDADHNLGCGNAVTIRGQEFGGGTATNGAFYITGNVGSVTIDASGDAELNEPFLKVAQYATSNVTVLGAVLRPGAVFSAGGKFIDWAGEGNLTLVGVSMSGRGASAQPDQVFVTTTYGTTALTELGVTASGILYDVNQYVRWSRMGSHSHTYAGALGYGVESRVDVRANTTRTGVACSEWRSGNAVGAVKADMVRFCHDGTNDRAFVQVSPIKRGLKVKNALTTAATSIATVDPSDVDTDPTTYGFLGSASCGGGCAAIVGGVERGYWVTFTYTGTSSTGFTGVSSVSGYAPAGTPVVAEWAQQATTGIVQDWTPTSTTIYQPLNVGGTGASYPAMKDASGDLSVVKGDASGPAKLRGLQLLLGSNAHSGTYEAALGSGDIRIGAGEISTGAVWSSADFILNRNSLKSYVAKTLTESAATNVFEVASGANGHLGVTIDYTIIARDGTPNVQTRQGTVQLAAAQTTAGASPTCVVGTATETVAVSTGTLSVTWTCATAANKITAQANAVSSLTQTTLEVRYQVRVNASATHGAVTPL